MLSSSSLGVQLTLNSSPKPSELAFLPRNSSQHSISSNLNPSPYPFSVLSDLKISRHTRQCISDTAPSTITPADEHSTPESEKLGVVVKLMEKSRIVLKFIWVDRNLGLALEQVIPGYGTIPLGPYYFWSKKDAWDNLKIMLETKPWISQKQVAILLNQAIDIIDLWLLRSGDLS